MKQRSPWQAWCPHLALRRAPMTDRLTLEVDVEGPYCFGRVRLFVAAPF